MSRTKAYSTDRKIESIAVKRLSHQEDCYGSLNKRSSYEVARDRALADAQLTVSGGPSIPTLAKRAFDGWDNPSSRFKGRVLRDVKRTYLRTLLDEVTRAYGAAPTFDRATTAMFEEILGPQPQRV